MVSPMNNDKVEYINENLRIKSYIVSSNGTIEQVEYLDEKKQFTHVGCESLPELTTK